LATSPTIAPADDAWPLVVLGAGAAGLLAAATAAEAGAATLLVEKNRRPGVKILMSGGTRCNLTQATDKWGIVKAYGGQGNFLHSALAALGPADLVKLIEQEGVPTKIEETGKIFPVSNRAADIVAALLQKLQRSGATLALDEAVTAIDRRDDRFELTTTRRTLAARKVLVTVGGKSYPGSGTTGDGYGWARELGHTIVPPRPALTPITTEAGWVKSLTGLTLPDVRVQVVVSERAPAELRAPIGKGKQKSAALAEARDSFLFTHFGLSGPAILDVSRAVTGFAQPTLLDLACDFLPGIAAEALEEEIRARCAAEGKKQLIGPLSLVAPRRLVEALLDTLGIAHDLRCAELAKRDRGRIVAALKACRIPVAGTKGFGKAEVTAGGIALGEVDSRTLESKLVPGLYFAGEVLDLDGPIGGYNFQAAFSTGLLAGKSAAANVAPSPPQLPRV
jgi:predicted Rossmann fold flavoprotein